jgi:SAM-dependent methyltransferase
VTTPAGHGPGHITADGCAVDVYAALRAGPEPDLIASAVPAGSSILELGAGAGRVTRGLVARGYSVVAVDESAEMLAHIDGAETVVGSIERLDLGRCFDAVLLCSHLINSSDPAQRGQFVATCARHVAPGGCVVIERHASAWFDTVGESTVALDGIEIRLRDVSRPGSDLLAATVEYRLGERFWVQTFTAARLDDLALGKILGRHGLAIDRYLDDAATWVRAVPLEAANPG